MALYACQEKVTQKDKKYSKKDSEQIIYELNFGEVKEPAAPKFLESDGTITEPLFPNEARLRNLDYLSDLRVEVSLRGKKGNNSNNNEEKIKTQTYTIGQIPIMVRSNYCSLNGKTDAERVNVKECLNKLDLLQHVYFSYL